MNRIQCVHIGLGRHSRRHLRNEVDLVGFAGFRQVRFVAHPFPVALGAVPRLVIIRRVQTLRAGRLIIVGTDLGVATALVVNFDPVLL